MTELKPKGDIQVAGGWKVTVRHASGHFYQPEGDGSFYYFHCPRFGKIDFLVDAGTVRDMAGSASCPECATPIGARLSSPAEWNVSPQYSPPRRPSPLSPKPDSDISAAWVEEWHTYEDTISRFAVRWLAGESVRSLAKGQRERYKEFKFTQTKFARDVLYHIESNRELMTRSVQDDNGRLLTLLRLHDLAEICVNGNAQQTHSDSVTPAHP